MLRVGLTGGIASGKSTVDRMLVEMGAHLVDTDQLARQAVEPGSLALAEIAQVFGGEMVGPDGKLDRARMRALVFGDEQARARLNTIVHPRINQLVLSELERLARKDPQGVVIVDVPLLFETGGEKRYDCTVLVYVPHQEQIQRLMQRDHCSPQAAQEALKAQMPLENKKKKADFLVDNSGSLDETLSQVERLWQQLLARARAAQPRS